MKVWNFSCQNKALRNCRKQRSVLVFLPSGCSILSIEEKLAQIEDEFRRSAEYVLQKNADLYRRFS
jgi:hypothetical protein